MGKSDSPQKAAAARDEITTPDPVAPTHDPNDPFIGQTPLGQYQILKKIGEGAFGSVYLADQIGVGRKAVVKVLRENLASSDLFAKRFQREAKVLAALDHHHLVRLYNFGKFESGQLFLAMEYGGDRTLGDELKQSGKLSPSRALHITAQICSALHEAHTRGVVHRDLKPDNIILSQKDGQDWVKVVDVGIAKMLDTSEIDEGQSELTGVGALLGTLAYFSPEQAYGQKLDGRSDVYSVGCILYEMLAGERPFAAKTAVEFIHAHTKESPRPLRGRGLPITAKFERTLFKQVLCKKPDARMTAIEFANWAEAESKKVETQRPRSRRRSFAIAALISVCALGLGSLWLIDSGETQVLQEKLAARKAARKAKDAQHAAEEKRAAEEREAALAQLSKPPVAPAAESEHPATQAAQPAAPLDKPASTTPRVTKPAPTTNGAAASNTPPASVKKVELLPPPGRAATSRTLTATSDGWLDSGTNLLWQKEASANSMRLEQAVKLCAQLKPGAWRLPTLAETGDVSQLERSAGKTPPMLDSQAVIWAATNQSALSGWAVVLSSGKESVAETGENHRVRCVRASRH